MVATYGERNVKQWFGLYKAVVSNNADPLNQQRVQMQIPQIFGTAWSTWSPPLIPIGIAGPPAGSQVAAGFFGGDPDKPYYLNYTSTATDWTLGGLVIGDSINETGTLTVYGANATNPAVSITGGMSLDSLTVSSLTVTGTEIEESNLVVDGTAYITLLQASGWIDPNTSAQAVWHSLSLNGSITNPSGAGVNGMFYKWGIDGCVEIIWDFILISNNGGITVATLPGGYRPSVQQNLPSGWNNQAATSLADVAAFAPYIQVSSNGSILFDSVDSNTNNTSLHGYCRVQLGSI